MQALSAAGHKQTVRRFEEETATALSSANALGVETARIVKSLIFSVESTPVVVLVSGDRRADMKAIAQVMGVKKVRMADPEMVRNETGFVVGAVPPVGHAKDIQVLMDAALPREGFIYPAAGEINNAFETTFEKLREITGAKVCRVSK